MATYSFPNFNIKIQSPNITICQFIDRFDGTGIVSVPLQLDSSPNNTRFIVDLAYTYTTELTKAERLTWALAELVQYEV